MKKLSDSTKTLLKNQFLTFPGKSDNEIAKEFRLAQSTVSKYHKEIIEAFDMEFIKRTAGQAIQHYEKSLAYFNNQITNLEKLKKSQKTIIRKGAEGQSYEDEVDLSPMEILAIEKHQTELQSRIVYLLGQDKLILVLKMIRNGDIQQIIS